MGGRLQDFKGTPSYGFTPLERRRIQWRSYQAIKRGKLIPQPCERCGAAKTEAHHEDYTKPFEVMWLCRKHHKARHSELYRQARAA